jgi:hypothetical protein
MKDLLRTVLRGGVPSGPGNISPVFQSPKTNFQDTDKYKIWDWMYWGAGCAGTTNGARAIIAIKPVSDDFKVYRFIAAKRGKRNGASWNGDGPNCCLFFQDFSSLSRNTVELIKLISTRFTEFLQRILDVHIGPIANFIGCQIGTLVRLNNIFDCVVCGSNDFL